MGPNAPAEFEPRYQVSDFMRQRDEELMRTKVGIDGDLRQLTPSRCAKIAQFAGPWSFDHKLNGNAIEPALKKGASAVG